MSYLNVMTVTTANQADQNDSNNGSRNTWLKYWFDRDIYRLFLK